MERGTKIGRLRGSKQRVGKMRYLTISDASRIVARSLHLPAHAATGLRVFLAIGAILWAQLAEAHAIIVRTSPAQGGVAIGNIGRIEVWYDAGIRDAFVALAVVSASGERVDKRDAAIDGSDPSHVSVGVNELKPGKYTVRYRALSADGHIVSGAWDFEVNQ